MVAALVLAGCGRDEIHAYTEPKDGAAPPMAHGTAATAAPDETSSAATPEISLKLPAGWTEIASDGVNLRCFQVGNSAGATATAGIARLGHLSGMEAMLVNMWRSQAGEPALPDDQAAKLLLPVDFAGLPGSLYEISGTSTNGPTRILVAFAHRPDGSWFCKLSGNSDLVTAQKPAFLDFVKTLEFKDSAAAPAAMPAAMTAPPVAAGASQFKWTVPPQWQAAAAGDMQAAVYKVTGPDGAKGEVSVSIFPNEAGGTLANINRWRTKFVGLAAVEEKDLPQLVTPLDPSQAGALLVDMKNGKKQLIGAIVPRAGQYWFYKFVGDSAAVTPQKDAFIAFAKSSP
jgi:hypothetical protein